MAEPSLNGNLEGDEYGPEAHRLITVARKEGMRTAGPWRTIGMALASG